MAWTRHSESCSQIPRFLRAYDGSQKRCPTARFTDVDARHNRYDKRLRFLELTNPSRLRLNERIIACALAPSRRECDIADAIRRASHTATPNRRMVAIADAMLERGGRMVAAIERIGRGSDCYEGVPFVLELT